MHVLVIVFYDLFIIIFFLKECFMIYIITIRESKTV
jgi:hypothetical protein